MRSVIEIINKGIYNILQAHFQTLQCNHHL